MPNAPQPNQEIVRESPEEWVSRWKRLGPLLEAQRERDAREGDVMSAFSFFAGMVKACLDAGTVRLGNSSGLVEQQMWFSRLRARR
jgi:hypothetical protein